VAISIIDLFGGMLSFFLLSISLELFAHTINSTELALWRLDTLQPTCGVQRGAADRSPSRSDAVSADVYK